MTKTFEQIKKDNDKDKEKIKKDKEYELTVDNKTYVVSSDQFCKLIPYTNK